MRLSPFGPFGGEKKKSKKGIVTNGLFAKGCIVRPVVPERCPHKAALCPTHGARSEGQSSGDGRWETPATAAPSSGSGRLPAPRCLRRARAAFSPPPMQALPPPLFSSRATQDSLPTSDRSGCAPPQRPLALVTVFFFHVMVSPQHPQRRGVREGGTRCLRGDVRRLAWGRGRRSLGPPSLCLQLHIVAWLSGLVGLSCFPWCHFLVLSSLFCKAPSRRSACNT